MWTWRCCLGRWRRSAANLQNSLQQDVCEWVCLRLVLPPQHRPMGCCAALRLNRPLNCLRSPHWAFIPLATRKSSEHAAPAHTFRPALLTAFPSSAFLLQFPSRQLTNSRYNKQKSLHMYMPPLAIQNIATPAQHMLAACLPGQPPCLPACNTRHTLANASSVKSSGQPGQCLRPAHSSTPVKAPPGR